MPQASQHQHQYCNFLILRICPGMPLSYHHMFLHWS